MTIPHSPPGTTAEVTTLADWLDDKHADHQDTEVCETHAADEGAVGVYQAVAARLGGAR
jgi:hypothetical protein